MTNTNESKPYLTHQQIEDLDCQDFWEIVHAARQGMVPAPPFPREVWGVQVGTWPPEKYQSEEIARWYADQPHVAVVGGVTYPVKVVKGTEYGIDWQVVDTVQEGEVE